MRQLGTIEEAQTARRFEDYLLTKGIPVSVEPDAGGWMIWVRNEDHLEAARREFAAFTAAPEASIYAEAARAAEQVRSEEKKRVKEVQRNFVDVRSRWHTGIARRAPVTILLLAASIAVAVLTGLGQKESMVTRLSITPYEIHGNRITYKLLSYNWYREPWRLITPIFVHFGIVHIAFNMLMLLQLGVIVEILRGSWRFILFVLLIGVSSNVAQYLWSGPTFGGMSGVLYGLFGYIWMKSRYEPQSGFYITPNTVIWMIGWFFLCMTGAIGPVANAAHGGGLVAGIVIGLWPSLWRSIR